MTKEPKLPLDVHWDMETGDPDDLCTLLLLIAHPAYRLRSVSVTPGTDEQVGMVKHVLHACGVPEIPVAAAVPGHDKRCVGEFYRRWLPGFRAARPDFQTGELILQSLQQWSNLTLLTGAPLKGLRTLPPELPIHRWVAQGGFAGDNVVPEAHRLEKFAGMLTCPTYNFNGAPETALTLLANPNIGERLLVSKNVCHGMIYDLDFHARMEVLRGKHEAWDFLLRGMEIYLDKRSEGKKFHDPLAAAAAAKPEICEFREVRMYRHRGGWGSELAEETRTWISVSADRERLIGFLTGVDGAG